MSAITGLRAGWGDLAYEVDPDWMKPRGDTAPAPVTAIAAALDGRVYVCRREHPSVLVFDERGEALGSIGADIVTDPHGITTDADGMVYIADRDRHVVIVFDSTGGIVRELGTRDRPAEEAPFNHPADVAVAPDGTIFVADGYGNSRVHVFSADGTLLRSWGSHGLSASEFRVPHGIAVDGDLNVYVADRENDRVQVFDAYGKVLALWTGFRGPTDICIDAMGRVFVTDHVPNLTALDREGNVLVRMRAYHDTHGVCCDQQGRIFVASTAGRAVVCYTPTVSAGV